MFVVLAIDVQVPLIVDCSQRMIVPTFPLNVIKPLFSFLQIEVVEEFKFPPTLSEFTSILAGMENSKGAVPL